MTKLNHKEQHEAKRLGGLGVITRQDLKRWSAAKVALWYRLKDRRPHYVWELRLVAKIDSVVRRMEQINEVLREKQVPLKIANFRKKKGGGTRIWKLVNHKWLKINDEFSRVVK
jgi:hypothetical protein